MNYDTDCKIYRSHSSICGVKPYFVLADARQKAYFDMHGGAPEAELIEWAEQFLDPFRDFLDCGSHVGTWGITYKMAGHSKVHCYEANPEIAKLCNAGFALNGYSQHCYDYGLWNENGDAVLAIPNPDGGGGSVIIGASSSAAGYVPVTLKSLDQFSYSPGFMKIDVEGAELRVLQGATETINLHKPVILFECWQDERGQQREELFRYLNDTLDYGVVNVTGWPEMWLAEPRG